MRSVTGFPGFLGSALVERLLARTDDRIVRLVQERYRELDCRRTPWLLKPAAADGEANGVRDRIELVTGDITSPTSAWDRTVYTNENTRPILGADATTPRCETYVDDLVAYVREHRRSTRVRWCERRPPAERRCGWIRGQSAGR